MTPHAETISNFLPETTHDFKYSSILLSDIDTYK